MQPWGRGDFVNRIVTGGAEPTQTAWHSLPPPECPEGVSAEGQGLPATAAPPLLPGASLPAGRNVHSAKLSNDTVSPI